MKDWDDYQERLYNEVKTISVYIYVGLIILILVICIAQFFYSLNK
jgi:hypothetical protein